MAFSLDPNIDQTIVAAAQRYGLDPNAMRAIKHIENRDNPIAQNPNSSAGGLYQFIDSTARQYGPENRFDPTQGGGDQTPQQLTAQDRMAGIGAALRSLDQGGGDQTQNLTQILQKAKKIPVFNRQKRV